MPTISANDPNNPYRRDIYIPPEGPPQGGRPSSEIYAAIGQKNLFAMCAEFYRRLGESSIKELFPTEPEELQAASRKQAMFLSGLIGGPPLYAELVGPPRMRARHMPFAIGEHERSEWLRCWRETLAEPAKYDFPAEHLDGYFAFLERFSSWMVNKAPEENEES